MSVKDDIEAKLQNAFAPEALEVIDESHKHRGHAGWKPEGETHFHVNITASSLAGDTRVSRQRRVHKVLADELAGPVHALSLKIETS